jgi:hypothetical protein
LTPNKRRGVNRLNLIALDADVVKGRVAAVSFLESRGTLYASTRISSFKFPECAHPDDVIGRYRREPCPAVMMNEVSRPEVRRQSDESSTEAFGRTAPHYRCSIAVKDEALKSGHERETNRCGHEVRQPASLYVKPSRVDMEFENLIRGQVCQ